MAPDNDESSFSLKKVLPGIKMALYDSRGIAANIKGVKFTIIATIDTKCDSSAGAINAFRLIKKYEKIDFLIGPFCDYSLAPIARYSPYWNLPVVSPGGMSHNFGQEIKSEPDAEYPLLTRIGVTVDELAVMIEHLLNYFEWKKISILYDLNGQKEVTKRFCHLAVAGLVHHFTRERLVYNHFKFDPDEDEEDDDLEFPETEIREMLIKRVGHGYSIVILCASPEAIREIMIQAAMLNFTNGEYVFLSIDLFTSGNGSLFPWFRESDSNERNFMARKGFEALMTITLRKPDSYEYKKFSMEVKERAMREYGKDIYGEGEVNSFVGYYYDAVLLFSLALNESLQISLEPINGTDITRRMWNRTFKGITGMVSIDENGDRNADYYVMDMNPSTGIFKTVAIYYGKKKLFEPVLGVQIHWAGNLLVPPLDTPICGFDGSGCPLIEPFPMLGYIAIVLSAFLLIISVATICIFRHFRLEAQLAEINWRIKWEDIMVSVSENIHFENSLMKKRGSIASVLTSDSVVCALRNIGSKQFFTKTGVYMSTLVAIKKILKPINITKPLLIEFKKLRDLQNDHIIRFLGVCIDPGNQSIITEYCQKGSLQDVLENEQIKLDNMFKFSLMQDIIRGMLYLHGSEVRYHNNLKSSNCVVDGRFVLKITDFGLCQLREKKYQEQGENIFFKDKLWTAPEFLRDIKSNISIESRQKADVFSFSIICQEIIYRKGPFWLENMNLSYKEIYLQVKSGKLPYLRPSLGESIENEACSQEMVNIIEKCWNEQPSERFDFQRLKIIVKRIKKDGDSNGNLLDNLLSRMEQYAGNLEGLVEERTSDYLKQKKRAEDLLYMMLPMSVAEQLLEGKIVEAVKFESVTIYFSDICGFTQLSAKSTPMEVVDLLNDLYTTFDTVIEILDVYKVETIGDAYMVVSGLPEPNGLLHAREISRMSLKLLNAVKSFKIRHIPNEQLNLRIGIHSGTVCAGIVGRKMPRYCLFGDTVNTASRMESNGLPLKIHISAQTKDILDSFGTFRVQFRGPVYMKGKGEVITWWLHGEENPEFPDLYI